MSILNSLFSDLLSTVITNDKNEYQHEPEFYFNGKKYDLSDPDDVAEVHDIINEFKNNPLTKVFFSDEEINKIIDEANTYVDETYDMLTEDNEDDAAYIAEAYLEDTIDDWENVPEDQKERAINTIADFYNWLEDHSEYEHVE